MVFVVVQWENENTINVINEKQVVSGVKLKEKAKVDITLAEGKKGRSAIYKATILKVCGEYKFQRSVGIQYVNSV